MKLKDFIHELDFMDPDAEVCMCKDISLQDDEGNLLDLYNVSCLGLQIQNKGDVSEKHKIIIFFEEEINNESI